jgi:hypothetical protein
MTNQDIIDKYLKEFYEVQKLKVPIELNSYLHRMINEALHIHNVVGRSEQLVCDCGNKHKRNTYEIHIGRCQNCLKDIAD